MMRVLWRLPRKIKKHHDLGDWFTKVMIYHFTSPDLTLCVQGSHPGQQDIVFEVKSLSMRNRVIKIYRHSVM